MKSRKLNHRLLSLAIAHELGLIGSSPLVRGMHEGSAGYDDTGRSSRTRASPLTPALAKTGHASGQACPGGCGKAGRQNGGTVMR